MAIQDGRGDQLIIDGHNLSGNVGSISSIASPLATLDVTTIDKYAMNRIGGLRDASMQFNAFFDKELAHPVLSELPTRDVSAVYLRGAGQNTSAFVIPSAKQIGYDATRGADGALTFAVNVMASQSGEETLQDFAGLWCQTLTPGLWSAPDAGTAAERTTGFIAAPSREDEGMRAIAIARRTNASDSATHTLTILDRANQNSGPTTVWATFTFSDSELNGLNGVVKVQNVTGSANAALAYMSVIHSRGSTPVVSGQDSTLDVVVLLYANTTS